MALIKVEVGQVSVFWDVELGDFMLAAVFGLCECRLQTVCFLQCRSDCFSKRNEFLYCLRVEVDMSGVIFGKMSLECFFRL
jgi:hypothetical protein